MKPILPAFAFTLAALTGCGSGGDDASLNNLSTPDAPPSFGTNSSRTFSTSSDNNNELALQESLKAAIQAALDSEDQQEFLDLFYLEDIEAERIYQVETGVIAELYELVIDEITFEAPDDNYENFDLDYRYIPNLDVLGEVKLQFEEDMEGLSRASTFIYGLIEGEYRLGYSKREFMQYDGPRNQQLIYSISGQIAPNKDQFQVSVNYQVSGLSRKIDTITDAGGRLLFPGQFIQSITVEQIVGDDDFYFQLHEGEELIYTSQTARNGDVINYVKIN